MVLTIWYNLKARYVCPFYFHPRRFYLKCRIIISTRAFLLRGAFAVRAKLPFCEFFSRPPLFLCMPFVYTYSFKENHIEVMFTYSVVRVPWEKYVRIKFRHFSSN